MPKYQLADKVNGPFGREFDSLAAAEAALDELVAKLLDTAKQEILLLEAEAAEREYREPVQYSDDELAARAEARIRNFHCFVETTARDLLGWTERPA